MPPSHRYFRGRYFLPTYEALRCILCSYRLTVCVKSFHDEPTVNHWFHFWLSWRNVGQMCFLTLSASCWISCTKRIWKKFWKELLKCLSVVEKLWGCENCHSPTNSKDSHRERKAVWWWTIEISSGLVKNNQWWEQYKNSWKFFMLLYTSTLLWL